jgi:hypothetical protein
VTQKNLAVLVALAGGAAFVWTQIISPKLGTSGARVQEAKGGIAINALGGGRVLIGTTGTPESTSAPLPCPERPSEQKAEASDGGIAINSDCGTDVQINPTALPSK